MPRLSTAWLRLPQHDDPEINLRAQVMHWLTVVALFTVVPLAALLPIIETTYRYSLPLYLVAIVGMGVVYVLVHTGRVHGAAVLVTILAFGVTIWASFASGGIASPQLSMAVLTIMLAGFLLSGRTAIYMAALLSFSLISLEAARDAGLLPQPFIAGTAFTIWAALTSVLALSALLLQLFVTAMRSARDEAADSAARLAREMEKRVAMEASLQQAQKLEALGRLSGGIAHDFNNILMVLMGECEMLEEAARRGQPLTEEELDHLVQIRQSTERASALTRQLLAFSSQRGGVPEEVQPDTAVARLRTMLARLIREDVKLTVDQGAAGDYVSIDPTQLDQVLMNLALNGSEAMPNGGELSISTSRARLGAAAAAEQDPNAVAGDYVCIEVSDTGEGIPREHLGLIFDPFFTTKGMGRGTGLGLASAHGIVSAASGHIHVESSAGKGTTFRVYLPLSASSPASAATGDDEREKPASRRILLCEDDEGVRQVTARSLSVAGHDVTAVGSAEAALQCLEGDGARVDLLITDVILPDMNGVQMARQAMELRPELPVLLISGYTARVLDETGLPSDMELLQKPFRRDALLERVRILTSAGTGHDPSGRRGGLRLVKS